MGRILAQVLQSTPAEFEDVDFKLVLHELDLISAQYSEWAGEVDCAGLAGILGFDASIVYRKIWGELGNSRDVNFDHTVFAFATDCIRVL